MQILYDISVLGAATENLAARTGVFRVVESVMSVLVKRKDINITLCGSINMYHVSNAMGYFRQAPTFANVAFSKPLNFSIKHQFLLKRTQLIDRLKSDKSLSLSQSLLTKVHIRGLLYAEKMLPSYKNKLIHPKDLKTADVYHSPFYPISSELLTTGIKSIFLTSYDLIPVIYPQYSVESVIRLIKNVLDSITPETWVLCISHSTRNDLLNYLGKKVNPERVLVTHLAASDIFYRSTDVHKNLEVRNRYNLSDKPYILSLCTLEPRKNIEQAIKAFVKLIKQENIKDLNLVLVGTKGWMFDKIFEEIESSSEFRHRIIITGFVPDEDLAPLYSEALMFVYPSHYEGFGLPPLEAMKCGTPVITSNTSSLPEVVGDAGIMISPMDLDALCEAMLTLYKNDSVRKHISTKSIKRAEHFSWEKCADETTDAYRYSLQTR